MNVFGAKSVFARSPELSHMAFFDCHSVKSGAFQKCFFLQVAVTTKGAYKSWKFNLNRRP